MSRFFLAILMIVATFTTITAQDFSFTAKKYSPKVESSLDTKFKKYQIFQLDTDDLEHHVRQTDGNTEIILAFGEEHSWSLDLLNSDLFADNYILRDGKTTLSSQRPIPMQGYLSGGNNERVALTVSENFIYGFIKEGAKTYYIEPLSYFTSNQEENLFVLYEEANVIKDNTIKCAVTEKHRRGQHLERQYKADTPTGEKNMLACKSLELAIASDFLMFQSYGSVAAVEAHNVGVMNTVATDYDDSFNDAIQFEIVEQFVPSTSGADPISNSTVIGTILDEFTAWAPTGFTNTHDLGQHWSARDYDTTTIGLAWIGVVCNSFRYHVLEDFTSTAWGLRVLTSHEMGHNFNQDHDASGTNFIMAPSVTNVDVWSPASIAGINSYIPTRTCLSSCLPDPPPTAAFTAEYTQICTGSFTRFTDNSTANSIQAINSWNWSFTGGTPSTSTELNPLIQYNNPGTYAVSLTVSNSVGGNTSNQSGYITVGSGGTDFFFNEGFEAGIGGFTIDNPDNGSVTWVPTTVQGARYGDQAMYMNNYEYNAAGHRDYLVSPTLDFSGRTDAQLKIDYAYTNYDATFSDSLIVSISNDNGTNWVRVLTRGENGAGSLATRQTTTSEFIPTDGSDWCFAGSYGSDCLEIDLSGYSSATTKFRIENYNGYGNNMYIKNVALTSSCTSSTQPTAMFSVNGGQGCTPFATQYFDNSTGSPTSWNWSFPGGTPATSNQQNPIVTYNISGTYSATLIVTNDFGSDSEALNNIITVSQGTIPDFAFDVNGMTVDFIDASQNATSYSWSFGDSGTSGQINASHTYDDEGVYPVTLTVTNACGSNSITHNVTIEGMPNAIFSANTTSGCAPLTVDFSNFSSGLNSVPSWSFPGGTPATSTEDSPTVVYNTPGIYSVSLTVTNSAGSDTRTQTNLIVVNSSLVGDFDSVADELTVDFTLNTTPLPTSVTWNFGDSNTSTQLNPTHTYAADGTYTVTLTATNECGTITETSTVDVSLTPTAPISNFTANNVVGCESFTVNFINQSSDNSDTYNWIFEGGTPSTSTDINPTVTYNTPGNYSVSLIAANEQGSNSSSQSNYITVNPLPSTFFVAATNELMVNFTNTSTDATSYSWEFGDANTSTEINPIHTYNAEGIYVVTLISSNDCGSIIETMEVVVELTPVAPVAGFIASVNEGCEPFTVEFINQSSDNTESLQWLFPGGTPATSTALNPVITYNTPGTFDVTLVASNAVGNNSAVQSDFIVVNPLPNANFSSVTSELLVNFTNNSQNENNSFWDFGDTNTSTQNTPTHTYTSEGSYAVTLTVTNECGTDVFTEVVEVSLIPVAPTAAFTSTINEGCEPFTVEFINQSSDNTENLQWLFPGGTPATSTALNPVITYNTPGVFDVTLIASNEVGNNSTVQSDFIVVNPLPNADFTPVANELIVDFTNNSQNENNSFWDFGDTNTSTQNTPTHTYTSEGSYTVILTVTNECGTDVFTEVVEVSLIPVAPTAAFTSTINEGCEPFTVEFINQSSDNTENLQWLFPGGTPATSTALNPVITYNTAGAFDVTLIASNEVGNNSAVQSDFIVVNPLPDADFTPVANELIVDFMNNSQNGNTYSWNFGDTNTSTENTPTHTYTSEGSYTVILTVANDCGTDISTEVVEVSLTPVAPTAAFTSTVNEGCEPFTVEFINQSSDNTESVLWTFPGGTPATSTALNPVVTYNTPGTFDVSLVASNEVGGNGAMQNDFIVVNPLPSADFTPVANELEVTFNNNSQDGDNFTWDFGDTNISSQENPIHVYDMEGTYLVTLIVNNDCGTMTFEEEVIVSLTPVAPTAAFVATETSGCAPFTVQYTSQSSANAESLLWVFEGGTPATSTEANPVVVYSSVGSFSTTLTATNEAGNDVETEMNYILVNDIPSVAFSQVSNALEVNFMNATTNAITYAWNFGDTNTSTLESPTHTYAEAGIYMVTLTVANECGSTEMTTEVSVSLAPIAPTAAFSADIAEGCAPLIVTMTNLSSDNSDSYLWEVTGPIPMTSSDVNPVFTFATAGVYSISLTATNEVGIDVQTQTDLVVVDDVPMAVFASSAFINTVNFFNNSQFGDTYLWNFGDNTTSTEENPSHEYATEGFYTVTLTATNTCGEAVWTEGIMVGVMMPESDFIADITEDCVPFVVQFTDNTNNDPTAWNWTFEGGTPATSTEQNPVVTFNSLGEYDVTLSAANQVGSNNILRNNFINALGEPVALFEWLNIDLGVSFGNTSIAGTSYMWNFGDGFSTTSVSPSHTYETAGIYTVTLTVENECGTSVFTDELDLSNTSIGELDFLSEFNLYPNPNNGQFTLVLTGEGLGTDLLEIRLINIIGQVMNQEEVNFTGSLERTYDHSNLAAGMYFVELRAGDKNVYKKVVIE